MDLHDRTSSSDRPGRRSIFLSTAIAGALLMLVVGLTSTTSARTPSGSASATEVQAETAAAKCNALITKGKKLVVVYERVYKYKFVKNKRSKSFTRKIVKVK